MSQMVWSPGFLSTSLGAMVPSLGPGPGAVVPSLGPGLGAVVPSLGPSDPGLSPSKPHTGTLCSS